MNRPPDDHMQFRVMVLDRLQDDIDTAAIEMQQHINQHTNIPAHVRLQFVYAFLSTLKKSMILLTESMDEIHDDLMKRERERWENELAHFQKRIQYMETLAAMIEKGEV